MANYSQWFVEATTRVAQDAFKAFRDTGCAPHFLYYKPNGLSFVVVAEGFDKPEGYELATGDRIPSNRTIEGLTAWVRERTSGLPVLPKD
jgi:hypothetical protein